MPLESRFLLLGGVGDKARDRIDQKVRARAMAGVVNLGDILELIVDRFALLDAIGKKIRLPLPGAGEQKVPPVAPR